MVRLAFAPAIGMTWFSISGIQRALSSAAIILVCAVFVAACGGGSGGAGPAAPPNPNPPPANADVDNDGVNNTADACVATPAGEAVDAVGCSATQLDPALCHSSPPGGGAPPMGPSVSDPILTKLEREAQYFNSGIREFGASATAPDHAQDAVTIFDGKVYVAYYGGQGNLMIARKPLVGCVWTTITFPYTQTDPDSHRSANIAISPNDRRIHIAWGLHSSPNESLNYIISNIDNATDVSDAEFTTDLFEPNRGYLKEGEDLVRISYPRFIAANNNNLLLFWRRGGSGNGDTYMAEYQNGTWSTQRPVIHGTTGEDFQGSTTRNPYLNMIGFVNNQVHVTWNWRENPGADSNHDLMHAYSTDNGITWLNATGAVVGNNGPGPFTINLNSDVLFKMVRDGTMINQCGQTVTSDGRVHVIHRYTGSYQYHRWGPDASENSWTAGLSLGVSGGRPKIYASPGDSLFVVGINGGRIRIYAAPKVSDSWDTFSLVYQTPGTERYITSAGYVSGDQLILLAQRQADDPATAAQTGLEVLTFTMND